MGGRSPGKAKQKKTGNKTELKISCAVDNSAFFDDIIAIRTHRKRKHTRTHTQRDYVSGLAYGLRQQWK